MFSHLLLLSFPPLLAAGMLGGIALLVIGLVTKPTAEPAPSAVIGKTAQLLVKLAILWSSVMGVYFALVLAIGEQRDVLWLLFVLTWPILMSAAPLRATRSRQFVLTCSAFAIVLSLFSFVSGFSIGSAYPLCAVLLVVAGTAESRYARSARRSLLSEEAGLPG